MVLHRPRRSHERTRWKGGGLLGGCGGGGGGFNEIQELELNFHEITAWCLASRAASSSAWIYPALPLADNLSDKS